MSRRDGNSQPSSRTPRATRENPFDVTWHERLVVLGTMVGALIAAIVIGLIYAPDHTLALFFNVPASFFGLGKFLPTLALRPNSLFSAYELGIVIGIMDTCTVIIIVYSLELFDGILAKANRNARLVLDAYPWMRKFTVPAIVLFVMFPVAGTGAVGGSLIGALLGMHRVRLIFAVSFGGFLGGFAMAFLTLRIGDAVKELKGSPYLIAMLVIVLLALVWGMTRAYKNALSRAERLDDPPQ